ncbi:unnamed protein product [Diamesa serratosioi]
MLNFLVVAVLLQLASSQTVNYCNSTLCKYGIVNVGCNNTGAFATRCVMPVQLNVAPLQTMILDMFNRARNSAAAGELDNLPQALRMPTVSWSTDLAHTAVLNTKQCKFASDCHNSPEFTYAGQTKFMHESTVNASAHFVMESAINSWYNNYLNTTALDISKFLSSRSSLIGTFTAMVTDRTNKIGCGMSYQLKSRWHVFLVTCNYASTNLIEDPVYKNGTTAAGCTTGVNPSYPALCSKNEVINPNA